jgi:hypothetical protein
VTDAKLASDPNVVYANLTEASFDPNTLKFNTRYFWRVDEVNDAHASSPWVGAVWNFNTGDFITIDDFENYDDVCNRVFFAWVDGFGHSGSTDCGVQPSNGNGTGSTVGNLFPPFAEQTIVHSGSQSMPMTYDNTGVKGYSEAVRVFATPLNLTQVSKYDTLKLYIQGVETNEADRLYVTLEDSAGKTVTVANPDSTILTKAVWTEWLISLSDLKAVNLASVAKMTIGVGNAANIKKVAGRLYVDDIRVGAKPLGLVSYYAMEGNAKDSSGNGFDGTIVGDANFPISFVNGPTGFGKAMSFMGVANCQYVALGTGNPSAATGQLSVSLWAKWGGLNDGWQGLIGKRVSWGLDTMMWQIEADRPTGNIQFQSGGVSIANNNGAPLPIGQWTHVAVTFDGTTGTFYVNGAATGTGAFSFGYMDSAPFVFGASGADPVSQAVINPFNGMLDEVRVYDRALSAAEVAALMVKK